MPLEFKINDKQVKQFLDLAPKKTSVAVVRATKRGTLAARTTAARAVAKDMGISVTNARKSIDMRTPSGATGAVGILRASLRRIPIYAFNARGPMPSRGRGRGVTYKSGAGRKTIPDAFIARTTSGHVGVFKRKGQKRLPINELFGPSIGRVFDLHRDEITARGSEVTMKELDRQLNRIFGIKSKKAA